MPGVIRLKARGRRTTKPPGTMNGLERKYAAHLEIQRTAGAICWFAFEGVKLRLANRTFYTPDFVVMHKDGAIEFQEVKAFWEDDARVKIKVAAEFFWMFRFLAIKARTKKDGGGWDVEEF